MEINKREKRENHAQHDTNINDTRSSKSVENACKSFVFLKPLLLKKGVTFSSVFFLREFCGYTFVGLFSRYLNTLLKRRREKSSG